MADLNFIGITTACTGIEISTPTAGKTYLSYVNGLVTKDFSTIKSYQIKWSTNCCTNTEIVLPVRYALELNQVALSCVDNGATFNLDIEIAGIIKGLIDESTLQYSLDGITYIDVALTTDINPTINVNIPDPGIYPDTFSIYVKFSNLDEFEYIVLENFQITGSCLIGEDDTNNVTYPTLPTNVVIDGITGYLDFNELIEVDPALSGVYQVIICEETLTTLTCVQNHAFLECNIKCDVIDKLVQCKDSDVLFFYDALRYSNNCTTNITYNEVCAIYELLIYKLTTSGCYSPWDDCNCSGTTSIVSQNNNSKTTVRSCGCNG